MLNHHISKNFNPPFILMFFVRLLVAIRARVCYNYIYVRHFDDLAGFAGAAFKQGYFCLLFYVDRGTKAPVS